MPVAFSVGSTNSAGKGRSFLTQYETSCWEVPIASANRVWLLSNAFRASVRADLLMTGLVTGNLYQKQGFCEPAATKNIVDAFHMDGRQEVIAAGQWLAAERRKRGGDKLCSQGLVAALATKRSSDLGDRFQVKQQQISDIERSRADNEVGPKKGLPHWWRNVVWLFESGEIDEAISAIASAIPKPVAAEPDGESPYLIQAPNGDIVGRIIWYKGAA